MPTLADVAVRAGVSIATVSKVISNKPYVSAATRQRVKAAIAEVGYVPNLAARALSTGKTHIVALVFPRVYDAVFKDPFVQHILEGVEAACIETGYNLLLSTPGVTECHPDERYLSLIESGYVDGIVAVDNVPGKSVAAPALEKGIPTVVIGYGAATTFVRSDDYQGAFDLMQHVLHLGHRHIGLIATDPTLNHAIPLRLKAFHDAAKTYDLNLADMPRSDGDFSIATGHACALQLLQQTPRPSALLCINDRMALGALQAAREKGLHVPRQLTIVGYDDIPTARVCDPPLTTVDQQAPLLGELAMTKLLQLMRGQPTESEIIPTKLVVRNTSAKVSTVQ